MTFKLFVNTVGSVTELNDFRRFGSDNSSAYRTDNHFTGTAAGIASRKWSRYVVIIMVLR